MVTDITYIPTREGWLYLALVLDLGSRRVVGWAMRATLDETLVLDALRMALGQPAASRPGCCIIRIAGASTPWGVPGAARRARPHL